MTIGRRSPVWARNRCRGCNSWAWSENSHGQLWRISDGSVAARTHKNPGSEVELITLGPHRVLAVGFNPRSAVIVVGITPFAFPAHRILCGGRSGRRRRRGDSSIQTRHENAAFLYLSAAPGRAESDWDLRVMKIPVRMRQTRMHLRPQESPPGFKCQT